ncbi:MAG: hypothetical protein NT027_05255 [Proteobacteria bacterium]|nr:hypothetical protein [Pseudomonadota bacterium]
MSIVSCKRNIFLLLLVLLFGGEIAGSQLFAAGLDSSCTFKGKKLWGKIQFVNSVPDVKVQVVNALPDLKVMNVKAFPDSCGKWLEVSSLPDLKVQIVKSLPDIKIQYVNSFPGIR